MAGRPSSGCGHRPGRDRRRDPRRHQRVPHPRRGTAATTSSSRCTTTRTTPIAIGGYKLRGSNIAGTIADRATVLAGTIIPARGHYPLRQRRRGRGRSWRSRIRPTARASPTTAGSRSRSPNDDDPRSGRHERRRVARSRKARRSRRSRPNAGNRSYERKVGGLEGSQVDTNNNADDFELRARATRRTSRARSPPAIGASPAAVNFGTIAVGLTSAATVTITNNTSAPVDLTSPFTVGGADAVVLLGGGRLVRRHLAAGVATTVTVTFQPASSGPKSAIAARSRARPGRGRSRCRAAASGGIAVSASRHQLRHR